ncbi:hypothetical protein [Nostoc sp. 'Peltigera malacea cyanobiont' DB3992]|uniref:hypothetical protein n=1 Tax=Nostoc sp. 'Peltigera malacea cyanobiont' DB3992 TaxID=1206980 RepID=UPI0015D513A5|nr:hypothetical protein [Nostoc sp. 'Peltigera malacea cyanobiont' DB3992]
MPAPQENLLQHFSLAMPVEIDSSNKGIVMLLPLSLDTWQSTLQPQLHSYLESLD